MSAGASTEATRVLLREFEIVDEQFALTFMSGGEETNELYLTAAADPHTPAWRLQELVQTLEATTAIPVAAAEVISRELGIMRQEYLGQVGEDFKLLFRRKLQFTLQQVCFCHCSVCTSLFYLSLSLSLSPPLPVSASVYVCVHM